MEHTVNIHQTDCSTWTTKVVGKKNPYDSQFTKFSISLKLIVFKAITYSFDVNAAIE